MALAVETIGGFGLVQAMEAAPAATYAPSALFNRQNSGNRETCGWWSFSDRSPEPFACGGGCTTTDSFMGCGNYRTTCYERGHTSCYEGAEIPEREECCTGTTYNNCITLLKKEDDDWYTNFMCAGGMTGTFYISTDLSAIGWGDESSSTKASSDSTTTETDEAKKTDNSDESKDEDVDKNGDGDDSSDGSSEPPIGAIVGGILGGLALVLLLGFGLWYVRFQKKKHRRNPGRGDYQPAGGGWGTGYHGGNGHGGEGGGAGGAGYTYIDQQKRPSFHGAKPHATTTISSIAPTPPCEELYASPDSHLQPQQPSYYQSSSQHSSPRPPAGGWGSQQQQQQQQYGPGDLSNTQPVMADYYYHPKNNTAELPLRDAQREEQVELVS